MACEDLFLAGCGLSLISLERKSFGDGIRTTLSGNGYRLKVSQSGLCIMVNDSAPPFRDPAQHSKLKEEIEAQSTAYYATARLWDDGIIRPTDTRDVVGLGLAISSRRSDVAASSKGSSWDGEGRGMGVFRM